MSGGLDYIRSNLAGAWQVMLGRPEGLRQLDISLDGFWRSFGAIVLILPFTMLTLLSLRQSAATAEEAPAPFAGSDIALEGVALIVDWIAFPLVFALLARPLGLGANYVPFIITRNWASVIVAAIGGSVHALNIVGLAPVALVQFLLLAVLVIALRFAYVIARVALDASFALALPVVALDFLISLVVWSAFGGTA
jgi:hypothetical protein